ncbi:MAG: CPBP family intramembrane metalloprotease [Lentisphaeria bacterium]|nr:CPBP family intramembrane metalloprotease [Lentisphaeria bacterium]
MGTCHEMATAGGDGIEGRRRQVLALVGVTLLLLVPSLGTWLGMWVFPGQVVGQVLFSVAKVALLLLPLLWRRYVDRAGLSLSPMRRGGLLLGLGTGFALSAVILGAYVTLSDRLLDPVLFRRMGAALGLDRLPVYLAGAVYWSTANSLLEEVVWRWFAVERLEDLGLRQGAVWLSALAFTFHHIVALRLYCGWPAVLLCSAGIFAGGVTWSALYRRTRSVWPGYASHAVVDVCVFWLGWHLIGGGNP